MDFRHLETFAAVVKHGSFLRAADALGCAQSTVTLHIQQLEAALGVELFSRHGRRVRLTEAGRLLHERGARLLDQAAALRQTMAELAEGVAGHVRLGAIEPTASRRLPRLLTAYCAGYPRVRLTLDVSGAAPIARRLAAGQLDLGLASPPPAALGLDFEPLFVEPLAVLLPASHPLAGREQVGIVEVARERLILTEPPCAYRDLIERTWLEQGANLDSAIEVSSMETLLRLVQAGLGLAVVPAAAATPPPAGTALRRLSEPAPALSVGLVRRSGAHPPSRALAHLADMLRGRLRATDRHGRPAPIAWAESVVDSR